MTAFLTSAKAADKPVARALMEKVVNASRTRVAARAHKENQRRKNALESSHLPPKLKDCRSSDPDVTELFIVEGDSALGTANVARNSEHQALLPIRGKILNVQKADLGAMLKNAECASIIQVVGAGSGKTFDLDQARYGKVIFMADATPMVPIFVACWPPCSSVICAQWWRLAGCSRRYRRCTDSNSSTLNGGWTSTYTPILMPSTSAPPPNWRRKGCGSRNRSGTKAR
ncbi:topoisomerase IV subunit B [Cutibacterium acnes JCM 18909]|nr:topoisomerase IV subunit B [Cutibacterium acnes JCM 18909]